MGVYRCCDLLLTPLSTPTVDGLRPRHNVLQTSSSLRSYGWDFSSTVTVKAFNGVSTTWKDQSPILQIPVVPLGMTFGTTVSMLLLIFNPTYLYSLSSWEVDTEMLLTVLMYIGYCTLKPIIVQSQLSNSPLSHTLQITCFNSCLKHIMSVNLYYALVWITFAHNLVVHWMCYRLSATMRFPVSKLSKMHTDVKSPSLFHLRHK